MGLLNLPYTIVLAIITFLTFLSPLSAQNTTDETKYRRSSLCQLMVGHLNQEFASDIKYTFLNLETPQQYNNHNLSVRVVETVQKVVKVDKNYENDSITNFLCRNRIASRLVAKWFNRDMNTGQCDMQLVRQRGLYNATEFDRQMALRSARGQALLEDAGEDLIANTFVVVNDIRYIDKQRTGKIIGAVLSTVGNVASVATNNKGLGDVGDSFGKISESLDGFRVKINSFLYRLVWNDSVATNFYRTQYASTPDADKAQAFEKHRSDYELKYVGKVESSGGSTSFIGIAKNRRDLMLKKALQRALDENIAELQKEFEVFRVKSPLASTSPLKAFIGLKEGMTEKSRYEVLETILSEDGKTTYKRVGVIAPEPDQIWDNRCMADLEHSKSSELNGTTFKVISGKNFYEGMLIREIAH